MPAHELGHMLQGIAHHSDSGIMKKHWTNREISDMAVRPLTFTEYDAMLIKESLVSVTK